MEVKVARRKVSSDFKSDLDYELIKIWRCENCCSHCHPTFRTVTQKCKPKLCIQKHFLSMHREPRKPVQWICCFFESSPSWWRNFQEYDDCCFSLPLAFLQIEHFHKKPFVFVTCYKIVVTDSIMPTSIHSFPAFLCAFAVFFLFFCQSSLRFMAIKKWYIWIFIDLLDIFYYLIPALTATER